MQIDWASESLVMDRIIRLSIGTTFFGSISKLKKVTNVRHKQEHKHNRPLVLKIAKIKLNVYSFFKLEFEFMYVIYKLNLFNTSLLSNTKVSLSKFKSRSVEALKENCPQCCCSLSSQLAKQRRH